MRLDLSVSESLLVCARISSLAAEALSSKDPVGAAEAVPASAHASRRIASVRGGEVIGSTSSHPDAGDEV